MAEIAFSLIKTDNLKKYGAFHIKQVETVVEIPGKLDSSTQQSIRDKVSPAFNKLRDELNDHIADMRGKIEQALKAGKSQADLKKALAKDIAQRVDKLDALLTKAVPKLLERDAELERLIGESLLKLKVASAWKAGNLVWEGVEAGIEIGKAVVTGNVEFLATVRGCLSLIKSIRETIEAIEDATSEEAELRKKIKPKLKELTKLKPPAKVPSGLVDEIERLLRTYPLRIAEVQQSVKPLAGQLDKLLDATERAKFPNPKQQKAVEASIQKLINRVIHVNQYSESGRKLANTAKEAANEAKTRRATDWNRVWGAISSFYDDFCEFESKMEIESITDLLKDQAEEIFDEWLEIEDDYD
jgi:methyl-accepting chemotaxis protein